MKYIYIILLIFTFSQTCYAGDDVAAGLLVILVMTIVGSLILGAIACILIPKILPKLNKRIWYTLPLFPVIGFIALYVLSEINYYRLQDNIEYTCGNFENTGNCYRSARIPDNFKSKELETLYRQIKKNDKLRDQILGLQIVKQYNDIRQIDVRVIQDIDFDAFRGEVDTIIKSIEEKANE